MNEKYGKTWLIIAWVIIVMLAVYVYHNSQREPQVATPVTTHPETKRQVLEELIQPFPEHGSTVEYFEGEALAPFKIITKQQELFYFIKVVEWESKLPVLKIFVHSGQDVDVLLPVGSYEVRFTSGKTWYGEGRLFGPGAKYEKADQRFDFMKSGQQIQGHTLKLIAQQGGNLRKVRMKADDF
jgi:hypothetical protein